MAAVAPAPVTIKQEKPDDPEILEMAAKIAEANRLKLAQTTIQQTQPIRTLNGAPNLRGYIVATSTVNGATTTVLKTAPHLTHAEPEAVDEPSTKGKFSWTVVGVSSVPVILRRDGKYISVRIMEMKVLSTHLNFLHPDIYLQARVPSYEMTEAECRLLNEINVRHCESKFGRDSFSSKDLVVKLKDAIDFFVFLDVCYHKLQNGASTFGNDKCGFIRINKDSVIPYTVKDGERYVPIFYFEGETDKLKTKSAELSGWELAYLKFCCKVQGIKNELFNNETCAVTSLNDIKSYFSSSDVFEEYWPNKVVDSQLLISATKYNGATGSNSWIRTPPPGPNSLKTAVRPGVPGGGVIAVNGVRAAPVGWATAGQAIRGQAVLQQQLAAAAAAAAARGSVRGSSNPRSAVPQYYTNPATTTGASTMGGVPTLVRPGAGPQSGASASAYAKQALSGGYTNLTQAGAQVPAVYKNGWPNGYSASTQQIQQMIAAGQLPAASYAYQTGSTTGSTASKTDASGRSLAPPPLIPVMHNGAQAQARSGQQRHLAAAASSRQQAAPTSGSLMPSSNLANQQHGLLCVHYDRKIVDTFQFIQEITTPASTKPYRISKARVQNGVVMCINRQPFMYSEDLMTTISDFIRTMAPTAHPKSVIEAFNVLSIKLYVTNRLQLQTLNETKLYKDVYMINPLISIVDIKDHIGAISYVLRPEPAAASEPKRSRLS
uniref:Uncharacterized protein n=1 Tax=Cacopsylla melanoneura TaxID=428564 RepID=A0A8D8ZNG1_9HEMI